MKFKIMNRCLPKYTDILGTIEIKDEDASLWYKEMDRRYKEDDNDIFDISESYELGEIGLAHLRKMLEFISKNR